MDGLIKLREYQEDTQKAVLDAYSEGITRPLVVLPTGTGKTVIFASIAKKLNCKTLVIAHRDELLRQAQDKISMIWPEAKTGIVKAGENEIVGRDVVIASIQTINREHRLNQIIKENFRFCITDEAHHSISRTYRETLGSLGFLDDDPNRLLLGVTATTKRMDKLGLKNIFQKIVYERSILTMVRAGYLSDLRGYRTDTDVDLTTIKTSKGDFIEVELSYLVNTDERNKKVVESYLEHAPGRKGLAFTAGVQHAIDLAEMFNQYGVKSTSISGSTPTNERKEKLRAFSVGEIQVLCNCNILTEGYDEPSIDCIILARPTKSPLLFTQMVGRGTRKHPGKIDCVILDFTDQSHDVCALPSLLGLNVKDGKSVVEEIEEQEERVAERNRTGRVRQIGGLEEFDLLGKSKFVWTFYGSEWRMPVKPGEYVALIPDGLDKFNPLLVKKGDQPQPLYKSAIEIGYAQGIGEEYARSQKSQFAKKNAKWRKNPPTDKQLVLLKKFKIDYEGMSRGDASTAIDNFFAQKAREKTERKMAAAS